MSWRHRHAERLRPHPSRHSRVRALAAPGGDSRPGEGVVQHPGDQGPHRGRDAATSRAGAQPRHGQSASDPGAGRLENAAQAREGREGAQPMMAALELITMVMVGVFATGVVLVRDPLPQSIAFSFYGLALVSLFLVLQAPDV